MSADPDKPEDGGEQLPKLSEEQEAVFADVIALRNILVTGPAGTGKSFLLKVLRQYFKAMMLRVGIVGSTGMAAVNVNGLTLHTWAGLGLGDGALDKMVFRILKAHNRRPFENIKNTNHLCIDEISMIPASLLEKVDHIFRRVRENNQPFGGMQVIAFGDFLQLPPVSTDHEHPEHFAFESPSWKAADFRVHVLTRVYRQENVAFANALSEVRVGILTDNTRAILNECAKRTFPDDGIEPVILTTHNADADAMNFRRLAMIEAEQRGYMAADEGSERAQKILERCLMPKELELKVGAQVMCVFNLDQERGIVNGTLGKVSGFFGKLAKIPVVHFANGIEMVMEPIEWKVFENDLQIGCRTQIPLRLAWAITVHKSQGMTLDRVTCHLARSFDYGQAYVALSRARTKEGLHIASGGRASIKAHPAAVAFYERHAQTQG